VVQSEHVARDEVGARHPVRQASPVALSGRPRPSVPPVLIDAALALVVAVAIGFAIAAKVEPEAAEPDAFAYCFAIALGGLMFLRRRWPAGVLIATMALLAAYYTLGYPAVGVSVPIAGAVYSAAEQGRLRLAILAAGAVLVVSTLYRLTEEPAARLLGFEGAQHLILLVAVIALGDSVRSRFEVRQQARLRAEQARLEHERDARDQVEQERLRIAREVHDVLAHSVSAISIQSVVGLEALPDEPDNAAAALRSIRGVSTRALAELRSTLGVLRDPAISDPSAAPSGPVGGLADLGRVVSTAAASGLTVTVLPTGAVVAVPLVVDAAAHRIVQESITNVLRHSASSRACVQIEYRTREIAVRISNPAAGQPVVAVHPGSGFGTAGMRERAELLGGTLHAGPTADGGFEVRAVLPFPAPS
jgi:signal transduction histidine kinase